MIFFFQAEDGIRDADVTGVQTCALPILGLAKDRTGRASHVCDLRGTALSTGRANALHPNRSEERRVGKECRSRWLLYYQKKKIKHTKNVTNIKKNIRRTFKEYQTKPPHL